MLVCPVVEAMVRSGAQLPDPLSVLLDHPRRLLIADTSGGNRAVPVHGPEDRTVVDPGLIHQRR